MKLGRYLLWCIGVLGIASLFSCTAVQDNAAPKAQPRDFPLTPLANPHTPAQCVNVDQRVSLKVDRGGNNCVTGVTLYPANNCSGTGDANPDVVNKGADKFYMGPIQGNAQCAEALHVETGSPCVLYEVGSAGNSYRYCYDTAGGGFVRVPLTDCLNHTGRCQ